MPLFSLPTPSAQDLGPRTDDRGRALPEVPRADVFRQLWGEDGVPKRLKLYMLLGPLVAFSGLLYVATMYVPRLGGSIGAKYASAISVIGWVSFMGIMVWSRGGKRLQLFGATQNQQQGASPAQWVFSFAFMIFLIVVAISGAMSVGQIRHFWIYIAMGGLIVGAMIASAIAWRRAYVRQGCKETGQRVRPDRALMRVSVLTTPLHAAATVVLFAGFTTRGQAGLLMLLACFAAGAVLGLFIVFMGFGKLRARNKSNPFYGSERLMAWLAASDRCGACGYPLDDVPTEADGVRLCPECGCGWHQDRVTCPAPAPHDKKRVIEMLTRVDGVALDDRGVSLPMKLLTITRWRRGVGLEGEEAAALAAHHRRMRAKRVREGVIGGVLLWLAIAIGSFVVLQPRLPEMVNFVLVLFGIIISVAVGWYVFRGVSPDQICMPILARGLCPGCGKQLGEAMGAGGTFDACVNCPTCGMAWKRERVGVGAAG